jgi:hypothetical protein
VDATLPPPTQPPPAAARATFRPHPAAAPGFSLLGSALGHASAGPARRGVAVFAAMHAAFFARVVAAEGLPASLRMPVSRCAGGVCWDRVGRVIQPGDG